MHRRNQFTVLVIHCFFLHVLASEWSYSGENGRDHWAHLPNTECGGLHQSPININTHLTIPQDFGELAFEGYNLNSPNAGHPTIMTDNGHTLLIHLDGHYKLSGGGLPAEYRAVQFHFHWGRTDKRGSEDTVNHHRYAAEMHVVHFNSDKFESFQEAAQSTDKDAVAVLGVFVEISPEPNKAFEEILDLAHSVEYRGQEVSLENHPFSVWDFLPEDKTHFYRYYGSFTTPPCLQIVIWTLFQETIKISEDQIEVFRHVHKGDSEHPGAFIVDNFRRPRPRHGRTVYYNSKAEMSHNEHHTHQ